MHSLKVFSLLLLISLFPKSNSSGIPREISITITSNTTCIINGAENPELHIKRGEKYKFSIFPSPTDVLRDDPAESVGRFYVTSRPGPSVDSYSKGLSRNGVSNGTLDWIVPLDAPDDLFYVCQSWPTSSVGNRIFVQNTTSFFQIWYSGNYIPPDGKIILPENSPEEFRLQLINGGEGPLRIFRGVVGTTGVAVLLSPPLPLYLPSHRTVTVTVDHPWSGSLSFETDDIQFLYNLKIDFPEIQIISENTTFGKNPEYLGNFFPINIKFSVLWVAVALVVAVGAGLLTCHVMKRKYYVVEEEVEEEEEDSMLGLGDEFNYVQDQVVKGGVVVTLEDEEE